jgi:anti-sigma B factor antagonist
MSTVKTELCSEVLVATITGNIDGQTAPSLQVQLVERLTTASSAVFDVAAVPYMSSAGFRLLLLMYRTVAMRGGQLAIVGLSDEIRDTMEMTGFLDFFVVASSVDEALAQVQHVAIDHAGSR